MKMAIRASEIDVPSGSELARVIEEAEPSPVHLVKDGVRYRLERAVAEEPQDDELSGEDEDEDAKFARFVGAWKGIGADEMKEMLRRAREEGSRPMDQPPILHRRESR
jgi:hypothetical protein